MNLGDFYNRANFCFEERLQMRRESAPTALTFGLALFVLAASMVFAQSKPTSLRDARAAVEANVSTAQGKAFDERFGTEFSQKHLSPLRQCKQNAGNESTSFWMLFKLENNGSIGEMLLYPETKLGLCARESLLRDRFATLPPRTDYWVSVYIKMK